MLCSPSKRLYRINKFQVINLLGPYVVNVTARNFGTVNIPLSSEHLNEKMRKEKKGLQNTTQKKSSSQTRHQLVYEVIEASIFYEVIEAAIFCDMKEAT